MTEANPQPSKENKTRKPVYLEHWCRNRAYKIKNSTFKSSNRWEIPYTTIQIVPLGNIVRKKRIAITFCQSFPKINKNQILSW